MSTTVSPSQIKQDLITVELTPDTVVSGAFTRVTAVFQAAGGTPERSFDLPTDQWSHRWWVSGGRLEPQMKDNTDLVPGPLVHRRPASGYLRDPVRDLQAWEHRSGLPEPPRVPDRDPAPRLPAARGFARALGYPSYRRYRAVGGDPEKARRRSASTVVIATSSTGLSAGSRRRPASTSTRARTVHAGQVEVAKLRRARSAAVPGHRAVPAAQGGHRSLMVSAGVALDRQDFDNLSVQDQGRSGAGVNRSSRPRSQYLEQVNGSQTIPYLNLTPSQAAGGRPHPEQGAAGQTELAYGVLRTSCCARRSSS